MMLYVVSKRVGFVFVFVFVLYAFWWRTKEKDTQTMRFIINCPHDGF